MDSCYASASIHKNGGHVTRSFETLAATHDLTEGPGDHSFTHALIKSLTELASDTAGKEEEHVPFDTSRLHNYIRREMLPHHHIPPIINRFPCLNSTHICLAPLAKSTSLKTKRAEPPAGILHLKVVFSKNRGLNKQETTKLGESLARGVKATSLNIITLDWVRFEPSPLDIRLTITVTVFLKAWIRNWRIKRQSGSNQSQARPRVEDPEQVEDGRPPKRLRPSLPTTAHSPLTPPGHV